VTGQLGAGGMGEVYRARDSRLGREVAIKVLPAERMADEGRRRRFVQEARAASSLNHPNIVTIHEIESAGGIDVLVMEYVPGQTLDDSIPRHGMRTRDALRVALPIAGALAAAHARGIVHRDLKPANVIVSHDGRVKLLDFGLAKLVTEDAGDAGETLTMSSESGRLARPGVVTGTAGYMSPEQATGGKVDARSDIFSFGALLYEMLTGRRAFLGRTVSETLAAIVSEQPQLPREIVPETPEALERVVLMCLRKEPERRLQHMSDVRIELQAIEEDLAARSNVAGIRLRRKRSARLAAAAALALATGGLLVWRARDRPMPYLVPLTASPGLKGSPSFSPDARQIAFAWNGDKQDNWDVYVKVVGSAEDHRLTRDPAPDVLPAWSPDGSQIAFVRAARESLVGTLHAVSPLGGAERKLSDHPVARAPCSWSPDGRWLATATRLVNAEAGDGLPRGIRLVSVSTGEVRTLTDPDEPVIHVSPTFSPDGRHLAYGSCPGGFSCWIEIVDLARDYSPHGVPRRVTRKIVDGMAWTPALEWSRDGRFLVYREGMVESRLWRVGIAGHERAERIALAGFDTYAPAIAPSAERLAFVRGTQVRGIFLFQPKLPPTEVTASNGLDWNPALSPNGKRLAYQSARAGGSSEIWLSDADGANAIQLTRGPGADQGSPRWSPDGRTIAFDSLGDDGRYHVWTIDAAGGSLRRLTRDSADENMPTWAPDGRFVYFSRGSYAGHTIWRAPATGGAAEQVSRTGGGRCTVSPDGRTLYFLRDWSRVSPLLAVSLDGGPERSVIGCVLAHGYAVTAAGIYYQACASSSAVPLYLRDPATGRERLLGTVEGATDDGLTVSADGSTILFAKFVRAASELVLIENFR
jgi:Tol biopolymer transport system component